MNPAEIIAHLEHQASAPPAADFADLDSLVTKKAKATKNEAPRINAPELNAQIEKMYQAVVAFEDAESNKKSMAADCIPPAETKRVEVSRLKGQNFSSIVINGLNYMCKANPFAKLDAEEPVLEKLPSLLVTTEYEICGVDPKRLAPEVRKALIDAGATFHKTVKPTKQYWIDRTLRPEIAALDAFKPIQYFYIKG